MRKSVGKPKQKFIAYAKVYKLVDGKYVPEHDSTHTSEGIGLNEFKSSCKGVDLANAMEQLVLKKKYIRELKKLEQGKDLIKVPSSHFPLDVSYLNDLEKKEYEKELKSEIERISDTTINGLEAVAHKGTNTYSIQCKTRAKQDNENQLHKVKQQVGKVDSQKV